MRIHYGGNSGETEEKGMSGESLPSAKLRRQGKRVVVHSSGAGHPGVSVRMPSDADGYTPAEIFGRESKECSICQMARNTTTRGASAFLWQEQERLTGEEVKEQAAPDAGMCTLRLPVREAKMLGQLLLDAVLQAEKPSGNGRIEPEQKSEVRREETPAVSDETEDEFDF